MAKPRMAKSARITELNLETARIPEEPSITMLGTVDNRLRLRVRQVIPSLGPSQPEKAQIAVEVTDHRHRDLRIENKPTDEHGDDVKLRKGAQVEATVSRRTKER